MIIDGTKIKFIEKELPYVAYMASEFLQMLGDNYILSGNVSDRTYNLYLALLGSLKDDVAYARCDDIINIAIVEKGIIYKKE